MIVGLLLIAAGWAVLYVGWWQAGRQEIETGQLPYLLSGGFGGWGLMLLGVGGVVADVVRQAQWRTLRALEDVRRSVEELRAPLQRRASKGRRTGSEDPPRSRRRRSSRPTEGDDPDPTGPES